MFVELLRRLALALERASLPYMVFGGQAVLLYGEPRLTRDIDVTLGVDPNQPAPVLRVIEELQLRILVDDAEQFLRQTFVLPVLDTSSNIRIDFVFSLTEYGSSRSWPTTSILLPSCCMLTSLWTLRIRL
jgi:hypothetical protein